MATKKVEPVVETGRVREVSRKVALAYVGAFGVAGDELGKLFERFVERGEEMEEDARLRLQENEKRARKFATKFRKEQKANVTQANRTVKKAVRQAQDALS